MQVVYHIGAHCTDGDQLVKTLLKNKGRLATEGIIVPGPGRYRGMLGEIQARLGGGEASAETQDIVLEAVMDVDDAERLIFGHERFLGAPHRALENGQLYPLAAEKATRLRNLFPDDPVEFFIGLRDIATFIPALFEQSDQTDFTAFMAGTDPRLLFWSDVIHAIREAVPECPVTVWCNEDTPLIWSSVLYEITGLQPDLPLRGGNDILRDIMAAEGMTRLRQYLQTNPPQTEIHRRRIIAAFLDKYALDEEVEQELDLPGWSPGLIEELTTSYDEDMYEIARIPGVTLLSV